MKPLIILELANNHMGDINHAEKIINKFNILSKKYRRWMDFAFKFQYRNIETFINENYKNSNHKGVQRFESTQFKKKQWDKIRKLVKKNFHIICTPFDEISVNRVIKEKFDYLKIASCSATDWPLLEHIVKKVNKNTKVICSLGGLKPEEISNTYQFLTSRVKNINFLYCVAMYPTNPEDLNLSYLMELRNIYGDKINGFSSHENPDEYLTGAITYSMGCRIFEKHVNIKNGNYKINDYSATPEQFKKWLDNLKLAILRNGSVNSRINNVKLEKKYLSAFKRGAYLKKNLVKKGYTFKNNDFLLQFPSSNNQLLANDLSKFSSIRSKKDLKIKGPVFKKNLIIANNRDKIELIRHKIKNLIKKSNIIVPNKCDLEISHHYGLEKFYKYGLSMITIFNNLYCKKLLFLLKNQEHPEQFHKKKKETFFILYGKVYLKVRNKKKIVKRILKSGELFTINQNDIHSFKSLSNSGSIIEELSSESNKHDSYYVDKKINNNKNRKSLIALN